MTWPMLDKTISKDDDRPWNAWWLHNTGVVSKVSLNCSLGKSCRFRTSIYSCTWHIALVLKGTHAYKSKAVKKGVKTVCVLTSYEIVTGKHQHPYHCWRRWEMKNVADLLCWIYKTRHYHVLAFAYIYNAHNYDKVFRIQCCVPATACINTIVSSLQLAMKQQLQTSCGPWNGWR